MIKKLMKFLTALPLVIAPPIAAQQHDVAPVAQENNAYNLKNYPDYGMERGLVWNMTRYAGKASLHFHVPETDDELWRMDCEKQVDGPRKGQVRIANLLVATPRGLRAEDQFGFTVRVDDGKSIGILARMKPVRIEGDPYHMPQFYLHNRHLLFPALARGSRAYINLNGNKFSVHLKGSGEAIKSFLRACR